MRFTVIGMLDATIHAEVEADSAEEAIDRAELSASLCCHCAQNVDLGDVIDRAVFGENGEPVIRFARRQEGLR